MATDRSRFTISVDDDTYDAIEEFRYRNKFSTRSKATEQLLRLGMQELLKQEEQKKEAPTNEDVAEAILILLQHRYKRPATEAEVRLFGETFPVFADVIEKLAANSDTK